MVSQSPSPTHAKLDGVGSFTYIQNISQVSNPQTVGIISKVIILIIGLSSPNLHQLLMFLFHQKTH